MEIGSQEWMTLVMEGVAQLGLSIAPEHAAAFAVHAREMIRWNRATNLTTITDPRQVAIKHFIDSIAAVRLIPQNARLLDVGSGGGFPGIPLKIVRPSLLVTLIDSSRRKVNFLKHVIRTLGLDGVDAVQSRVQDLAGRQDMKMAFDVVICRALTDIRTFVRMALPLLGPKGFGLALKGKSFDLKEGADHLSIRSAGECGPGGEPGVVFSTHTYRLPFDGALRVLVTFRRGEAPT